MRKTFEFLIVILLTLTWLLFDEPLIFLGIIGVPLFFVALGVVIAQIF